MKFFKKLFRRPAIMLVMIIGTGVQGQIVEGGLYPMLFEIGDEPRPFLQGGTDQKEHVGIVGGIVGHIRHREASLCSQVFQALMVHVPYLLAAGLDVIKTLQLCPEEGAVNLRRQEAGARTST